MEKQDDQLSEILDVLERYLAGEVSTDEDFKMLHAGTIKFRCAIKPL